MQAAEDGWKRIREVAASTEVPAPTVRYWIRAGKLEVRTRGGVKFVDPAAVRALAADRARAKRTVGAGNASGSGNGMATGRTMQSILTPELEAQLFQDLGLGENPIDIVQKRKVSSALVVEAHKRYQELLQAAAPPAARLAERLAGAEERIDRLEALFAFATNEGRLTDEVKQHELRLQALEDELATFRVILNAASRKISTLTEFRCSCGAQLVNVARCPACNVPWDLRP